jgi:reactive intermediate/imine deaminase
VSQHRAPLRYSEAEHPYSVTRTAAGLLFVSGQLGVADGEIVSGGIIAETHQAFANLEQILTGAGVGFSDIVKITVYLASMTDRTVMDRIYRTTLPEPLPARTCVAVAELPFRARIELDVIARITV